MNRKRALRRILPFCSLYSLVLIRYLYYGFTYFYQLDDYIQYFDLSFFSDNLWQTMITLGSFQRPAAGFSDLYIWSFFFPVMILAVALIAALYTATALLLRSVFCRFFRVGWLFPVLFALLPLGFEGTYWVSASSRIVCGLFFAALGAWLFQRYLEGGRWYFLLSALVAQLLSCLYYEQVLVFSVTLFVLLGILNFRRGSRRCFWCGFSVVNAGIFLLISSLAAASGGVYAGRMELVLPVHRYYFDVFLPDILNQIKSVFWDGTLQTTFTGFLRGLKILVQDRAVLFALLLVALCLVFAWLVRRLAPGAREGGKKRMWCALVVGVLLAVAPVTPFLIIANPWFSFRGAVASFAGLALIADVLITALFCRFRRGALLQAGLAGAVALVFCVAGVSELHDYRQTMFNDHQVADTIVEQIDLSDPERRIGILGAEPSFLDEQNYFWHEHIHGVTESSWALMGMLEYKTEQEHISTVVPLPEESVYRPYNYENNRIDSFDLLYYYDFESDTLTPLYWMETGERSFALFKEDGTLFGTVTDDDGRGVLTMK